jgi:hypothetical protein
MAGARRATRAASNCTPSVCFLERLAPREHDARSRLRTARERIENDQHQRSAHHCSKERAQISFAARRRRTTTRGFTPMGYRTRAPCFTCTQAVEKSRRPWARERPGIFRARNMRVGSRVRPPAPALKSPIGPIGTSIPAAYVVCEHRDNGSEPIASRQHARCYRLPPEASSTRHEGRGCEKVPVFDRVRRRTVLPENGSLGERRAHHP